VPRPLVFGNGRLLVQCDHRGNIRDFAWPIGIWNHLSGRAVRIGVWAEGGFSWLDSARWDRSHRYESVDPLVGVETHDSPELGVRIEIRSWIPLTPQPLPERGEGENFSPPSSDTFRRRFTIRNLRDSERDVRLFVTHDFRLMESDIGDCALWHPVLEGIVHFKGTVSILARLEGSDQFACGITEFADLEGTWRDAEDGELSGNPIAQGSVDSTVRACVRLEPHGSASLNYELRVAGRMEDLGPFAWTTLPSECGSQPVGEGCVMPSQAEADDALDLAIIRTQIVNTGAVLAANDSDIMETNRANYSYCWPRDAANVLHELLERGHRGEAERFIDWAQRTIAGKPFFLQKYRADGTLGATWHPWTIGLPIQQDETASVVSLVAQVLGSSDAPSREDTYDSLIRKPLEFFLTFRDSKGLPLPSYDLWEERRGVHAHTVATVIAAFRDGAALATDQDEKYRWNEAAAEMTAAFRRHLVCPDTGRIFRNTDDRQTIDAATLLVEFVAILPKGDPVISANREAVESALWVNTEVGGLARYQGDYYFRVGEDVPGNPWIITTLWLAQSYALAGNTDRAQELLNWANRYADETGVLPEQVHPFTGEPLSVAPLTWSHAERLRTRRLLLPQG
jgi:GH15 family glucan-1,4-alpha-glucosidase